MKTVEFTAKDGKKLSVKVWEAENPKMLLQISHGMVEHAGRYDAFARYLSENGITVFADDHRAHGDTAEILGYDDGDIFASTLSDLHELTLYFKEQYKLPVVLFGHSYGSFLSQAYLENYSADIEGIVIGGSCYMKNASVPAGKFIANIGYIFKGKTKPAKMLESATFKSYEKKLGGSFISSIPEEVERYERDEKCNFTCSYAFYKYFFKGLSKLYNKKKLENVNIPVLLISGENDPVGNYGKGVRRLEECYVENGISVTTVLYKGVRHEYLNDTSRSAAYEEILKFALGTLETKKED